MSALRRIQRLYRDIPAFKCVQGCTDCCGPVPFAKSEWNAVKDKRVASGITCPYAVNGRCEIYDQRPLICRLFGAVDHPIMTCPKGCGPGKKLKNSEARKMITEHHKLIDRK